MLERIGMSPPIVHAPMAGISAPALAAAVSDMGMPGSIGVGATDASGAHKMIEELQTRVARPFNVDLFVQNYAKAGLDREEAWLEWLRPLFAEFEAEPPRVLGTIYPSFADDAVMLAMLLEDVSFSVVENSDADWSFGFGRAQFLTGEL